MSAVFVTDPNGCRLLPSPYPRGVDASRYNTASSGVASHVTVKFIMFAVDFMYHARGYDMSRIDLTTCCVDFFLLACRAAVLFLMMPTFSKEPDQRQRGRHHVQGFPEHVL